MYKHNKIVSIFTWRDGHHPRKDKSNIFVSIYAWTNVTKASIHTTVVWLNELRNNTHKHTKRNNHHVVNTKRSSLLHFDSKLWSINFVLNNIKIKSTTVFERYKMVYTCTFNYVTMSIPNPKRNRCARPQLRTLIDINIKGYQHRWILLSSDYNKTDVDVCAFQWL